MTTTTRTTAPVGDVATLARELVERWYSAAKERDARPSHFSRGGIYVALLDRDDLVAAITQALTAAEARVDDIDGVQLYLRVKEWAETSPRKPAQLAFTQGIERNVARLVEESTAAAEAERERRVRVHAEILGIEESLELLRLARRGLAAEGLREAIVQHWPTHESYCPLCGASGSNLVHGSRCAVRDFDTATGKGEGR